MRVSTRPSGLCLPNTGAALFEMPFAVLERSLRFQARHNALAAFCAGVAAMSQLVAGLLGFLLVVAMAADDARQHARARRAAADRVLPQRCVSAYPADTLAYRQGHFPRPEDHQHEVTNEEWKERKRPPKRAPKMPALLFLQHRTLLHLPDTQVNTSGDVAWTV
jgi:hypothetical protein